LCGNNFHTKEKEKAPLVTIIIIITKGAYILSTTYLELHMLAYAYAYVLNVNVDHCNVNFERYSVLVRSKEEEEERRRIIGPTVV